MFFLHTLDPPCLRCLSTFISIRENWTIPLRITFSALELEGKKDGCILCCRRAFFLSLFPDFGLYFLLQDNSPSPTIDANGGGDPPTSNNMIEVSSEEDTEDKVASSHHPAAFGRGSVSQIKVASNDAERLQLLAEKAGMSPSSSDAGGPTTINNNLKSNHAVKNINVNSNINNHNQTKQLNTPKPPPQVIDTNANLPKPEINPPMDKVQIGELNNGSFRFRNFLNRNVDCGHVCNGIMKETDGIGTYVQNLHMYVHTDMCNCI